MEEDGKETRNEGDQTKERNEWQGREMEGIGCEGVRKKQACRLRHLI